MKRARNLRMLAAGGALLAMVMLLAGCNKVTGGGQLTCIGPWTEVGLYVDTNGDEGFDWGFGIGGEVEYDRCTFGFTAQMDDDPETRWTYEAKGQMQLVDHTKGIVLHSKLTESISLSENLKSAEYEAWWESWVPGAEPPGRVTAPDGSKYPIDFVYFVAATQRWALVDRSVAPDRSLYPKWPYRPILQEGYGDVLRVGVWYNDWSGYHEWIGLVENGNLTVHKAKKK